MNEYLNINKLHEEVKRYFGDRAIIENICSVGIISAEELWKEELTRVRDEELDYYDDFSDEEIPLITSDVYTAIYRRNKKDGTFQIIDSYMMHEDFNIIYLRNSINDQFDFVNFDAYGCLTWII